MPIVKMPDGVQVQFPDTMPADQIKGIIAAKFPESVPKPQGQHLSFEEGAALLDKEKQNSLSGMAGSALTGALEGVPIAGPAILGGVERAAAGLSSLIDGESYGQNLKQGQNAVANAKEANPYSNVAGQVAGNVASLVPLGATGIGARALGMTGPNLLSRAGMSALSSGAISGADSLARGGDGADALASGGIGAGIGGAIPLVGAGISAGAKAIGSRIAPTVNALTNPTAEASRRLGMALTRDVEANPTMLMNSADEAAAAANNIPVVNADRGGETTRALARSVANQSPEARAVIENTASDRFGAQSQRAADFVSKLTNGRADDLAYQEAIKATARQVNKPAYAAAYSAPEAQQVFTPRIQELMQSPSFRRAVDKVPQRSADRGAIDGFKEMANPFVKNSQGAYVLQRKADGTLVTPTLQFWDHVKRNLDSDIGKLITGGDRTRAAELTSLKNELLGELDSAVPAFKNARQGAAGFFGAEDALEAGKKFATTPKLVPEAVKAFQSFKPAEKDAFATGYASELIDRIKASGDRTNVINSVFKTQAGRESMSLVFGPQKMREIEAYVRVEDIADRLRGSMGNSTTARQLIELGIGAGAGGAAGFGVTGDWKGALLGAAGPRAAKFLGQRADAKVMEQIGKLLTSDNKSALRVAVQQAAKNPAYMDAIEQMGNLLAAPARGVGMMGSQ
jgi:hypothetical protein